MVKSVRHWNDVVSRVELYVYWAHFNWGVSSKQQALMTFSACWKRVQSHVYIRERSNLSSIFLSFVRARTGGWLFCHGITSPSLETLLAWPTNTWVLYNYIMGLYITCSRPQKHACHTLFQTYFTQPCTHAMQILEICRFHLPHKYFNLINIISSA